MQPMTMTTTGMHDSMVTSMHPPRAARNCQEGGGEVVAVKAYCRYTRLVGICSRRRPPGLRRQRLPTSLEYQPMPDDPTTFEDDGCDCGLMQPMTKTTTTG